MHYFFWKKKISKVSGVTAKHVKCGEWVYLTTNTFPLVSRKILRVSNCMVKYIINIATFFQKKKNVLSLKVMYSYA